MLRRRSRNAAQPGSRQIRFGRSGSLPNQDHHHGRGHPDNGTRPPTLAPVTRSRWLDSPLRRAADVVVAGSLLLIASPILALIAVAVRVRLGSPVLFRQTRAGRDGEQMEVIKYRSMSDVVGPDGELLPDEQRLGAFGRALRASSLDELPQLFCVLRGDMSLIGPRPLPTAYIDRYDAEQRRRLAATPGITGWAQVQGRNALDWPARLAADVWYVDHASPSIDLRIVALTIRSVFARSGVNADGHATMPEFLGDPAAADPARSERRPAVDADQP